MQDFKLCIVVYMQPILCKVFMFKMKWVFFSSHVMWLCFQIYSVFVEIMFVFVETKQKF